MRTYRVAVVDRGVELEVLYDGPDWTTARAAWDVGRSSRERDRGLTLVLTESEGEAVVREARAHIY